VRHSGLEELREILSDSKVHLAIGKITGLDLASDRSVLRVKVEIFPELREIVARMTWEQVGPESGIFGFPVVGDLVLVGFPEAEPDLAFVLKRLTSKEDKIPLQAVSGDTVVKALAGKKVHLHGTKVFMYKGDSEPTQPLILGTIFKTAYSSHLEKTSQHTHIGNFGYATTPPDNAADFLALKNDPVDNNAMLSDVSFTEKGS
jgi:hypothetical protein